MAFVQSSGWNALIAWVRIASWSARVNGGERVIPLGVDDPILARRPA